MMKEYADFYFRKAKAENYPARSVYKLKEIDARHRLLKAGMHVLDLGAAPGSWSLYAAERVGGKGLVLACDLQATDTVFPPQVQFMQEDIFEPGQEFVACLRNLAPFDLVMSDMAPSTTGNRITDHARSVALVEQAYETACLYSRKGSNFIAKIFMGGDMGEVLASIRKSYASVKTFKPKSSRAESKEIFIVCQNFKLNTANGESES